jgi:DNA-binding HxlR family transcriptional regulator
MKRYGQTRPIARALDVVGERWSLLLVRELSLGPRRYRDLATGLPGIPSNLLAARLKDLQAAGVITRRTLPAPTDVTVYELTDAGRALQPALHELLDWGLRYGPEPSPDDVAQPGWGLQIAVGRPSALPDGQTCELRIGPESFYLSSDAGTLTVRRGPAPDGDAVVTMSTDTLYSLLTGQTSVTSTTRHDSYSDD